MANCIEINTYGRSIRSKEDWAITYVLDSAFGNFVSQNKNILPDWFTQAIQSYNPMLEIKGFNKDDLRKNLAHVKIMQRERLDKKEGHILHV